jgi:uncharacterized protein (DUF58 family)
MIGRSIDKRLAIKLQVKKHVLGRFLGTYKSLFRGQGIEYDEIRKYLPGDDPKAIVWAKLAQLNEPYVKTFLEERDLTVLIALDTSGSIFWNRPEKAELALETAASLIFSAAISRDRVGLVLFSEGVETYIHPRRGMPHAGHLVQKCADIGVGERKTLLEQSLRTIEKQRGPKRAVIFVISDFISEESGWEEALVSLSRRNDMIALHLVDSWEQNPPALGWICAEDPEEGSSSLVYCNEAFSKKVRKDLLHMRTEFDSYAWIELNEGEDPLQKLRLFFQKRCQVLRRM